MLESALSSSPYTWYKCIPTSSLEPWRLDRGSWTYTIGGKSIIRSRVFPPIMSVQAPHQRHPWAQQRPGPRPHSVGVAGCRRNQEHAPPICERFERCAVSVVAVSVVAVGRSRAPHGRRRSQGQRHLFLIPTFFGYFTLSSKLTQPLRHQQRSADIHMPAPSEIAAGSRPSNCAVMRWHICIGPG